MFFTFVSRFHKAVIECFFRTVFTNERSFLVIKFVLNTKLIIIFSCVFELTGWDVCFNVTLALYLVP